MVQAPKSGQNQGQSGVFLWSANYTPSGPQINQPGFLHQPSLGVTRTANENHHLVQMERPHLMDGVHGYYLPYHAGEEHIGGNGQSQRHAIIQLRSSKWRVGTDLCINLGKIKTSCKSN
ncbi:hypothetical protein GQR58_005788 [Nymphon striatum]|nr:hypothetical protein GQR58_005788 [Nymphon striatum]